VGFEHGPQTKLICLLKQCASEIHLPIKAPNNLSKNHSHWPGKGPTPHAFIILIGVIQYCRHVAQRI